MKRVFSGKRWILWLGIGVLLGLSACSRSEILNILVSATPSPTITLTPSQTPSLTATPLPSATATLTPSQTPTFTETPTETPTTSETLPVDTVTPGPSPTNTRTPTNTYTPSATPTETFTPSATPIPSITPSPTPHMAFLRLSKPGWMSKVVSPIRVEAVVSPGENGKVEINLVGEDGRVISNQELKYSMQKFQRYMVQQKLEFSIPGPAEYGRLEIRTHDRWGRNMSITSVDLLLMAMGREELYAPISLLEPYIIYYPDENSVIEGGTLLVNGVVQPVNQNPLVIELIDEAGQLVGATKIDIPSVEEGHTHAPFSAAVPYQVNVITEARLMIYQESAGRIPGIVAMTSQLVVLKP